MRTREVCSVAGIATLVAVLTCSSLSPDVLAAGEEQMRGITYVASMERPISLDFQNADVNTVLRSFAAFSGRNIITGPEVKGTISVRLENVLWKDALAIVLRANGYAYREVGDVIRVSTIEYLSDEEIELATVDRQKEELLPVETHLVEIDFANASEMADALDKMLTKRGTIQVDPRTNHMIITDVPPVLERIEELVQDLDTQTPQVEIVARMVDLDISAKRDIGIKWNIKDARIPGTNAIGGADVDLSAGADVEFSIGVVGPGGDLDATLDALEQAQQAEILANPRITTMDNREATIIVGKKIPLIVADEAGNAMIELYTIGVKMAVTPHVTSGDNIVLDLHPEVSDLSSQATVQGGVIIVTSEADTRVMVADGQTAVIGGLIRTADTELSQGVPFLRGIPLVGRLFGSSGSTREKRELMIFVTPHIVRDRPTAGSTSVEGTTAND